MSDPLNRKPWPMKWVLLAILACVVPYTWITVAYRKPNPAYQPYEDSKQRANVHRLLEAGYRRIHLPATPTNDAHSAFRARTDLAAVATAPAGLTPEMADTLVEIPPLPLSFGAVSAPAHVEARQPYSLAFTCIPGEQKHPLAGAHVYVKEGTMVIVPSFAPPVGTPPPRAAEESVVLTLPVEALKPGTYTAHLAGRDESRQWTIEVR